MRFDDVLDEIGGYGIFQKYVFYLTWPINAVNAFYILSPVFILGIPEHRCAIPGYHNDTFAIQSTFHQELINRTVPDSDTDPGTYDKCHIFVMSSHSYDSGNSIKVKIQCDEWVYDKSVFKDTFVSKTDLVCGDAVWVATMGMLFYFGMLVGSIVSGVVADRLMPESPRWLISKGRVREAELIIRKAARWNKMSLPAKIFDDKTIDDIFEQDKTVSCLNLLSTTKMLSRSLLTYFNWLTCSFVYIGLALDTGHLHGNLYLNFALGGLVEFSAYLFVVLLVDRTGRRLMYIITMATGAVSCISTLFVVQYGIGLEVLSVTFAMIGRFGFTAGLAVLYIFTAEIFPTVLRNAGLGSALLFASVGTMIAPYIVNWGENMGGTDGRILPLSLFGGLAMLSAILTLFLPEPLNKQLPETIEDGMRFG